MTETRPSQGALTPSQRMLCEALLPALVTNRKGQRPLLLTGEVGVGKTLLAQRMAGEGITYHSVARQHLPALLAQHNLTDLTPEAVVRHLKDLAQGSTTPTIVDGLDLLLSMWAVESPGLSPNFFVALGRLTLDRPLLVVIRTSAHLPYQALSAHAWFPRERCFRLELTLADKEAVARNWSLDPMRARVSANLYELLATKLEG